MYLLLSLSCYSVDEYKNFLKNFLSTKNPQYKYEVVVGIMNNCTQSSELKKYLDGINIHYINTINEIDLFNQTISLSTNIQYDYLIKCHTGCILKSNWDSIYTSHMINYRCNLTVFQISQAAQLFHRQPFVWQNIFVNYVPLNGAKLDFCIINRNVIVTLGYIREDLNGSGFINYLYKATKKGLISSVGPFDLYGSEKLVSLKAALPFKKYEEKDFITNDIEYYDKFKVIDNLPLKDKKHGMEESYYQQRKMKIKSESKKLTICTIVKGRNDEIPLLMEQWIRRNFSAYKNIEFLILQEGGEIPDISKFKSCMPFIKYLIIEPIKYWNRNRLINYALKKATGELFMYCPVDYRLRESKFLTKLLDSLSGINFQNSYVTIPIIESRKTIVHDIPFEKDSFREKAYIINRDILLEMNCFPNVYEYGQENEIFLKQLSPLSEISIMSVNENLKIIHNSHSDITRYIHHGKNIVDTVSDVKCLCELGKMKNLWEIHKQPVFISDNHDLPTPLYEKVNLVGIGSEFGSEKVHIVITNEKMNEFNENIRCVLYSHVKNVYKNASYTKMRKINNGLDYPYNCLYELLLYIPSELLCPKKFECDKFKEICGLLDINIQFY